MIDAFLIFINQGWVGIIIGIVMSFLLYKISIRKTIPAYQIHFLEIIRKNKLELSKDIKILYNDKAVDNLTKIEIVFWNEGKDTLKKENIVSKDLLRFEFSEDTIILNAQIISKTREINQSFIKISEDNQNIAYFGFDYLDNHDGMIFEIIHTGENVYPTIKGSIKGIPEGIQNYGNFNFTNISNCENKFKCFLFQKKEYLVNFLMFLFGIFIILIGINENIFNIFKPYNDLINSSENIKKIFIIVGIVYTLIPIIFSSILWKSRNRFPKKLIPKNIQSN
ncbi:hypothetical protein AFAEC_0836 [Aliarcobacter faecis]|uniref:hypothetical protein n=1 Tax=Aliarcobacter faecis TaxID=1564138 RepID=UPI00047924F9|nr:hypothetical protein [Aliarcobacter faecis]QKF73011.1 hypothetical protein AFAEC_0836 [Aliarcobacter faecis]